MGDDVTDAEKWERIVATFPNKVNRKARFRGKRLNYTKVQYLMQFEYGSPEWEFTWDML